MNYKFRLIKNNLRFTAMQYLGNNGHVISMWSKGAVVESPVCEPTPDNPTGYYLQVYNTPTLITIAKVGWWVVCYNSSYFCASDEQFKEFFVESDEKKNSTFSTKYVASKFLNEVLFIEDKKDYAKAACLYNDFNRLISQKNYNDYILRLIYEDFYLRVNTTKWNNLAAKTHLLNVLNAIYRENVIK